MKKIVIDIIALIVLLSAVSPSFANPELLRSPPTIAQAMEDQLDARLSRRTLEEVEKGEDCTLSGLSDHLWGSIQASHGILTSLDSG